MDESGLFLGIVVRVWQTAGQRTRAQLRPLYEDETDHEAQQRRLPKDEALAEFPNQGLVSWLEPPPEATEGSLWQFRVVDQPSYDVSKPHYDRYMVTAKPRPLVEVLDLRSFDREDQVRRLLTGGGLYLPWTPSQPCLLWIEDDRCVGPTELVRIAGTGTWKLGERDCLRSFSPLKKETIRRLEMDDTRYFLVPGSRVGRASGMVDWGDDAAVLRRVLRTLRRTDAEYCEALELTNRAINRTVEVLSTDDLDDAVLGLDQYRIERSQGLIRALGRRKALLDQLSTDLLEVPAVAKRIGEACEQASEEARREAERRVQTELQTALEQLETLRAQAADARMELVRLDNEIAKRREEAERQVSEIEDALKSRLDEVMARPEAFLADVAMWRTALRIGETPPEEARASVNRTEKPKAQVALPFAAGGPPARAMFEVSELRRNLTGRLAERWLAREVARPLHAAFLAGMVPVLAGSGAFDALQAYADCIAGGRLLWLPVLTTALEPASLLGSVDMTTREFLPAPGGLIDLLLHAADHATELYVVALDGINRAPIDAYLAPLLACYADAGRGSRGRMLPLAHPTALSSDDPYYRAHWLSWPPNVLLAATLAEGAAALPPPLSMWSSAILLHLDQFAGPSDSDARRPSWGASKPSDASTRRVPAATWQAWRDEPINVDCSDCDELLGAVASDDVNLTRDFCIACERLYAAALSWRNDQAGAIEDVIACSVIPCIIAQGGTLPDLEKFPRVRTDRIDVASKWAKQVLS